jgi:succinyl-CoA synthetase beta subunit
VELGRNILAQSNMPIIAATDLADAAEKIVTAVKEAA